MRGKMARQNQMETNQRRTRAKREACCSRHFRGRRRRGARPPRPAGRSPRNSSILIAAESAEAYPGLIEAAQYLGPVTEVAQAQGLEVVNEPYEFVLGGKTVVRGDFQKDVGKRVMRQSTLVVLARGYVVSFTFIGGTEDEVEELIDGLGFGASNTPGR